GHGLVPMVYHYFNGYNGILQARREAIAKYIYFIGTCRAVQSLFSFYQPLYPLIRSLFMNILLVYPEYPDTFWSFSYALKFTSKKAAYPPLGLLTVAAMLPAEWEKKLVDMNVK